MGSPGPHPGPHGAGRGEDADHGSHPGQPRVVRPRIARIPAGRAQATGPSMMSPVIVKPATATAALLDAFRPAGAIGT